MGLFYNTTKFNRSLVAMRYCHLYYYFKFKFASLSTNILVAVLFAAHFGPMLQYGVVAPLIKKLYPGEAVTISPKYLHIVSRSLTVNEKND